MKKLFFGVATLYALATVSCSSQKAKPLFDMPMGVQAYTYRASFPNGVATTLDTVKALGITEMEGPNPKNISPGEFKKMLDDRGISMPSIGLDYNIIATNPQEAVRLAKIFGSKYVMVAWIPHGDTFTIDDAKKAVADFNAGGKVLQENGITLCYHNHGYEFGKYEDGTLFDYIAKNTDPKYVSFELDMLWAFHGGADPAALLLKYPTRWKLMHLKDIRKGIANDLTGGTDIKNDVALGTGQINVPEVIKTAKKVGVEHYFIEDESPDHAAQIPETIKYLKSL
ncbi:sugar phosphate isomerase/epimerase [Mucilaginibacter sp. 14171R-50]|uniref:sugar phosphate isomerase/epimerase family protein n=1 Tax=Mucilaginibacter sp. 14171R-50 TaxID=2703789 RepID=UPI00138CA25F|nr:sugar phosphate isomerase/epimerase [Mucilaginibacter sp. 14171R-50]QHS56117.1 sugar phosphate isomerase/epimerase [Mucilaginibacter sp. 14171R-50]